MCDYSLHLLESRPAKVGDKLVSTRFTETITRGFASVEDRNVAVCLLPGTELASRRRCNARPGLSFPGGSGTGWRSSNRSTRADQMFIATPLSFPMEKSFC